MIKLSELLKERNFDFSQNTILVRHKDKRVSVNELIEKGYFEIYQATQSKPIFDNCKYMISFIGLENTKCLFYNIYENMGIKNMNELKIPKDNWLKDKGLFISLSEKEIKENKDNYKYYEFKKLNGFEDLSERVIIDWGKAALSWAQNYKDKEIIQILPKGFLREFSDYLDFTLSYNELKKLYDNQDANQKWIDKLSSINGIYLILDKKTGDQYVGSAYGKNGIWGRWKTYANNGHGGNNRLINLLEKDKNYVNNFQWTILETLPSNLTNEKVIEIENKYKVKLGSKIFGLNMN